MNQRAKIVIFMYQNLIAIDRKIGTYHNNNVIAASSSIFKIVISKLACQCLETMVSILKETFVLNIFMLPEYIFLATVYRQREGT